MSKLLTSCMLGLLLNLSASGQSLERFYDRSTLQEWKLYYDTVFNDIYRNSILPVLTQEERRALRSVKIDCPLFGEQGTFFDFYASPAWGVRLSALSLRFWGDLALAYSWLSVHNYSVATIWQYIAMLRYHGFDGSPLPRPLDVLIPEGVDVRSDPKVVARAEQIIAGTFVFILGHELGHLYHGIEELPDDAAQASALSIQRETQADEFALSLMYRLRVVPIGIEFWFQSASCWASDVENTTHPLNGNRIKAAAEFIEMNKDEFSEFQTDPAAAKQVLAFICTELGKIGDGLKDFHEVLRRQAPYTTVDMVAPRREDVFRISGHSSENVGPFIGNYSGVVTSPTDPLDPFEAPFSMEVNPSEHGGGVLIGKWTLGNRQGVLSGYVSGNEFNFEWGDDIGRPIGKGSFSTSDNGNTFKGTWGNGESASGAANINGQRK